MTFQAYECKAMVEAINLAGENEGRTIHYALFRRKVAKNAAYG